MTKPPTKLSRVPKPIGSDLVAERARDAVGRELVLVASRLAPIGRSAKTCPSRPPRLRRVARHRHVADRALVLDGARSSTGGRSFRAGPTPASTDRATSWPSSTRATTRRSTRPRPSASSGRCGTPRSCRRSGTAPCRRERHAPAPAGCGARRAGHATARQPRERRSHATMHVAGIIASRPTGRRRTSPTGSR